jgi:pSer/pThr/pTyr-binding forkhead associated (FHA) protein
MSITCNVCGYDQNPQGLEFCDACGAELIINTTREDNSSLDNSQPTSVLEPTIIPDPFVPTTPVNNKPPIPEPITSSTSAPTIKTEQGIAKLNSKLPNAPIPEFIVENYGLIGIFDPDTGPVDIDLENFLGSETVSRQHGEIYLENGQWKIKDLGSTNGIFIKKAGQNRFNARIISPEIINDGDEIAIAKIRFGFKTT